MTVADLIKGALRTLAVTASGETPTAAEQSDAFAALNAMLDSWSNERLAVYATVRTAHTLTPGLNPHTFGFRLVNPPTFNSTQPIRIDRASIIQATVPDIEIQLKLCTDAEWQATQGKTVAGIPMVLWVEKAYPVENLWLNPVPDAAHSLVLYTWQPLTAFSGVTQAISLPPGYVRALQYALAVDLAPSYGVEPSATLVQSAMEAKAAIMRTNEPDVVAELDPALTRPRVFNIHTG